MIRTLCGMIAASLLVSGGGSVVAQQPLVPVLIRFQKAPQQNQAEMVKQRGGLVTRQFKIVPAFAAKLPAAAIGAMRAQRGVAAVELDLEVLAHDYNTVWGVSRIQAPLVHSGEWAGDGEGGPVLGTGIRVAVLDTGIDYKHPDLAANYVGGYDFVNADSDPLDDHGHGTHVAGTIAALWDNVGAVGVAPQADLFGLKVLSSTGRGSFSEVIAALDWAINNNMQVLNLSLGSAGDPGTTVRQAFDNAYAMGLVVVASAGNAGSGTDTVGYPAKYDSVIAVGSTTSTDALSSFSSTGPAVEIAAPGSAIYSTYLGGGYSTASGTSMASPHVAGVAALTLAAGLTDLNGTGYVNDEVRSVLQTSAQDLGTAGRDSLFGFGLVDAASAVFLAANPSGSNPPPPPRFDPPSNLTGTVLGSLATLTWLDNANVEDGFQLQYGVRTKNTTNWQAPILLSANTTTWATNLADATYRFRVRAVQGNLTTAWSNEISLQVSTSGVKGGKGGGRK